MEYVYITLKSWTTTHLGKELDNGKQMNFVLSIIKSAIQEKDYVTPALFVEMAALSGVKQELRTSRFFLLVLCTEHKNRALNLIFFHLMRPISKNSNWNQVTQRI